MPYSIREPLSGSFFLFSFSVVLASLGGGDSGLRAEDWLARGNRLITEGRFTEAVDVLNRFKQIHPKDSRSYFYLGMAFSQMGRMSAAATELNEAVRLQPNKPEYHLFQADVLTRLGHKHLALEALTVFKKDKTVNPLTTAWLWLLSDVYYRLEQNDDALRILELLAKRTPGDPRNDLNRGQIYLAKGNQDLARKSFQKSIEKKPTNNALAYFELGKILQQKDEMISAKKALLEAVTQDGTNPEYLHKLGVVCLALNEVEEAIQYLKRAEPSGGSIPEIYYNLGRAYQKQGRLPEAENYLKKFQEASSAQRAKKNRSRESGNLLTLGEKELDRGNKVGARDLFEQVLQGDPDNWDAHGYLAEMFLDNGELERARPHLVKMEEIDPESVVGNYLMATYWYRNNEFERARNYAERAKSTQPGNAELRHLLGDIYARLSRQTEAMEEYEAAVKLAPDRSDYHQSLEAFKSRTLETNQEPKGP